jgi:hypothetical protein
VRGSEEGSEDENGRDNDNELDDNMCIRLEALRVEAMNQRYLSDFQKIQTKCNDLKSSCVSAMFFPLECES